MIYAYKQEIIIGNKIQYNMYSIPFDKIFTTQTVDNRMYEWTSAVCNQTNCITYYTTCQNTCIIS